MKTNWQDDWGIYKKGEKIIYDYTDSKGEIKTTTSEIDYVLINRYYSLFVLEDNFEYVLYSKLWLKLNNNH